MAIIHLLLVFSIGLRGGAPSSISTLSAKAKSESNEAEAKRLLEKRLKETDPVKQKAIEKEMKELGGGFDEERPSRGGAPSGDPVWQALATQNLSGDAFLAALFYKSKIFTLYLIIFLSGLFEILRVVFLILLLSAVARAARDSGVANKSMLGILSVLGTTLLAMIVMLILTAIDDPEDSTKTKPTTMEEAKSAAKKAANMAAGGELVLYLLHAGGLVMAAIMAIGAKNAAARRS